MASGLDIDDEFSFEPIVFKCDNNERVKAASDEKMEEAFHETPHDEVEETKDLPLVIKCEPDYVESFMEMEENLKVEVKQKKEKKSVKVQKKKSPTLLRFIFWNLLSLLAVHVIKRVKGI